MGAGDARYTISDSISKWKRKHPGRRANSPGGRNRAPTTETYLRIRRTYNQTSKGKGIPPLNKYSRNQRKIGRIILSRMKNTGNTEGTRNDPKEQL